MTAPIQDPSKTIGARTDHRAVAEVYGRVFAASIAAGHDPETIITTARVAAKGFVNLLRETA